MAWITLAIAPVLILLMFQFSFLPYHSHLATWTHRLLILGQLAVVYLLWPGVLDARREPQWVMQRLSSGPMAGLPFEVAGVSLLILVSLIAAAFPGEPHLNLLKLQSWSAVDCGPLRPTVISMLDRLHLAGVDVVDDERMVGRCGPPRCVPHLGATRRCASPRGAARRRQSR